MCAIARTFLFCLCLTGAFQLGLCSQFAAEQQSNLVNGVLKDLPTTECDMIVVSPSPIHGEISCTLQIIYYPWLHLILSSMWTFYEIVILCLGTGRSSYYFNTLKKLYSTLDEAELARRISSMPCFIAFARADSFSEGVQFLDHILGLRALERPIKSKKMHVVLMTKETIDETLLRNKTNHFNVHMINQGKIFF